MEKKLKNKKKNEVMKMSYSPVLSAFSLSNPEKKEKTKKTIVKKTKIVNAKKGLRLLKFVRDAIVANGGNYEDIYQKMLVINAFAQKAKELGVDCEMQKIVEGTQDFFVGDKNIVKFQQINDTWMANYQKRVEEKSFDNVRSMFVMQHEGTKSPVLYFGQHRNWVEFHAKQTYFLFSDNTVYFHDEYTAYYDEFVLWGNGTKAEFVFDEENRLTKVVTQKRHEKLNWIWYDPKTYVFEDGVLKLEEQKQENKEELAEGQKALPKGKKTERTK